LYDERRGDHRPLDGELGISVGITVVWLISVSVAGQWSRVGEQWAAAVTMIFGSFVAGSTPQGGGAVAFPVFTKLLDVPTEVARSFSLLIQTVGMGAASLSIWVRRRPIASSTLVILIPAALVGFAVATLTLTDSTDPFRAAFVPSPYVKVGFTVVVAAMAVVVFLTYRQQILVRRSSVPELSTRVVATLVIAGLAGGLASALVGSGADVAAYIATVVVLGANPRIGVPTSVIVMTAVSALGFFWFGLAEGQLFESSATDLGGLWLAAVPVVAWGAPLGSLVASRVTDRQLVAFVMLLAAIEVVTTVIFLDALRTDLWLALFGIVGLTVAIGGLAALQRNRAAVLGLGGVDPDESFVRSTLDVGKRFRDDLERGDR